MELITTIKLLVAVLAGGTIFAWYQFAKILISRKDVCSACVPGQPCEAKRPFRSKCFVGAVFFTLALGLAVYAIMLV